MIAQISGSLHTGYALNKSKQNRGVSQNPNQIRYNGLCSEQSSVQYKKDFPTSAYTIICSMFFMLGFILLTGALGKSK